jgi:hypothetical protein
MVSFTGIMVMVAAAVSPADFTGVLFTGTSPHRKSGLPG